MNDTYPAHIRRTRDGTVEIQTVSEHCKGTAAIASVLLQPIHFEKVGSLCGLIHDAGKYTAAFQSYITRVFQGEKLARGSVNHTFTGVRYILEEFRDPNGCSAETLTKDILAYAVGAHHGTFDCIDENGKEGFQERETRQGIFYEEAVSNYLRLCCSRERLQCLFEEAENEIQLFVRKMVEQRDNLMNSNSSAGGMSELQYYYGCLGRLVLSAVIDGDRRNTSEFMGNRTFPLPLQDMREAWGQELTYMEGKLADFDNWSVLNQARRGISENCRQAAELEPGIFRLNVPTGAGKTLSSLRFALAHAKKWNFKHIFFVSPLLSVLEQNAEVVHTYLQDQTKILEHHSNVVQPEDNGNELNLNELLVETWDAPVIITTLVQLLNTMFSGETRCIRRFHSLCNAVLVIDEVQSVPGNMLTIFNLMLLFLTRLCGTTVVLCSATQPYLEGTEHPIRGPVYDIVPYSEKIWEVFHRTEICNAGAMRLDQIATYAAGKAVEVKSLLVICNRKDQAERLYQEMKEQFRTFHLSASMCMNHRRKVLKQIRDALREDSGKPVVCIATQVIQAGVDISFQMVIRLLAGMDSVVQSAGRCNRNRESETLGKVYVVDCSNENLRMLSEIQREKTASQELLYEFEENPGSFRNDLSSEEAIREYYIYLYRDMPQRFQDYMIPGTEDSLYELLSDNNRWKIYAKNRGRGHVLQQAFRTAGREFHVFDKATVDAIVPYEEGNSIIGALCSLEAENSLEYRESWLRKARGYAVTVYPYQMQVLQEAGALHETYPGSGIWYLANGYYDPDTGVTAEPGLLNLEV